MGPIRPDAPSDVRPAVERGPEPARLRAVLWLLHIALPLLGLWLLVANPMLDVVWENHPWHFWLVLGVALVNVWIGYRMSEAALSRTDIRLFLVSLAFVSSAGFLLLHALATPGVLLAKNGGFVVATPVGLFLAAVFGVLSSFDLTRIPKDSMARLNAFARIGLAVLLAAWAAVSLLKLPPLDVPIEVSEAHGGLLALAWTSLALYAVAAARYYLLYRRRPAVVLLSVITAFALLAEAMFAVAYARNWHASWWLWHLLMLAAFGFVAYSARVQYRREGSSVSLFNSISLEETVREIRREHTAALESLVDTMRRQELTGGGEPLGPVAARLATRFGLTEGQTEVLERAAEALVNERDQIARLHGLVELGRETRVILDEEALLTRAVDIVSRTLPRDAARLGLVREGRLRFAPELYRDPRGEASTPGPYEDQAKRALATLEPVEMALDGAGAALLIPLTVKGMGAGVLIVERRHGAFAERDRSLLQSIASQLSIALENARLYQQIDSLFRSYMSPAVATSLLADPDQAALGGAIVEVSVLFADLQGYTSFSEASTPDRVVGMLNRYFGVVVPIVLEHGGTVVQFVGDAIMAVFNAPTRQADHPLRAARAALEVQRAIDPVAAEREGWPRFRVGINTGPALVGNIGSSEIRNFTAIGDTTNLAARLEASAQPGQVVIGPATRELLGAAARVRPLGPLTLKGKQEPVEAFLLLELDGG